MKRAVHYAALSCALLTGCASGPKPVAIENGLPPLSAGHARIYIYRTSMTGGIAVEPGIDVNGQHAANCTPGGVYVADLPAGNYVLSVTTEVQRKLSFALDPGEEKFVRCYLSYGFFLGHGNLELVDPAAGRQDIKNLAELRKQAATN